MVWLLGRMKCSASGAELPETSGTPTNHNLRDSAASAAEIRSGVRRVYALISYPGSTSTCVLLEHPPQSIAENAIAHPNQ